MKMKCGCEPMWNQMDFWCEERPYCPVHDTYEIEEGAEFYNDELALRLEEKMKGIARVMKNHPKGKQARCERCNALLEYLNEDVETGAFGCAYVVCLNCGHKTYLDEEEGKLLTIKNIKFPKDFTDHGEGINIDDIEINEWVKKCLKTLKKNRKDCSASMEIGMGNTMVFVRKYEDECRVWVTRDYYETSIPR